VEIAGLPFAGLAQRESAARRACRRAISSATEKGDPMTALRRFASTAVPCLFAAVAVVTVAHAEVSAPAKVKGKPVTTASGLKYWDLKKGTGAVAKAGDTVKVHYTGWLTEGKKFDSSLDRGEPLAFKLGAGMVIRGWDEGVAGMKVGGKRQLHIPAELGYGARGAGDAIPPNAELIFDVELVAAN
jgi:FKBP-type peptidyl-prolyl cis-trans isomerase FkpA